MSPHAVLPAMRTSPSYIFFTDFDGTITLQDSNDFLTDNLGYGKEKRLAGNEGVLSGTTHFRDLFQTMLESIPTPFDECIAILLKNIKLDPGFKKFYTWSRANNVPVVILSGGMEPIIRALLVELVGEDANEMQIVSNNVGPREGKTINEKNGWKIVFHDDSGFGHDKSLELKQYSSLPEGERPIMFYAGDGVSDLSAAKETDLLFAKKGKDLVTYCIREKVPFTEFEDWTFILSTVQSIVTGKTTVQEVSAEGRQPFRHHGK